MSKFRTQFDFSRISKELYQWFPGHMAKGLKKMHEHLPSVDAVIEVHDARAPFTGRNLQFRQSVVGNKPYAYVLNKADLTDLKDKKTITSKLAKEGYSPVYFTNLRDSADKTYRKILPDITSQIENQFRFNRELATDYHLLVVGVPNVGKSTLINKLRNFHLKKGNAVKVGSEPGITRAVQSKVKINQNPLVFIYDTPGVLEPTFENIETGFKLACLNCVKNHQVNSDILADYLLFRLNKSSNFKYVEYYGLKEPSDTIFDVLLHIAKKTNKIKIMKGFDNSMKKIYDIDAAGHMLIKHFFDGHLGKSMLDEDIVLQEEEEDGLELDKFMRCHYEVLAIPMDATVDDIKKAYRKAALQWHPDKHSDNKEEANRRFLEIQDAYETLSNDQERAWYDSHREVIINGGIPGEADKDRYVYNIYPYFSPTCYRGYGDDEKGFYTVYREMFVRIAEEDRPYYEKGTEIPEFGKSDSDYDTLVAPFYAFWLSYCCPRSFVWVEQHDVREANDRYVRRIMEKENKKARDKAKKERNEEIRKIVEHVRKRDKRVEQYKKLLEEKALLAQQKAKEKKEADRLKRIEELKNLDYDWSAVDQHLEELELEEKRKSKKKNIIKKTIEEVDDEEASGEELENMAQEEDESEYDDSLYCVACDKSFRSEKAFQNHERSKKHKENVDALKKHMREENAAYHEDNVDLEEEEGLEAKEEFSAQKTKLSKKQKKKKKQQRLEGEINEETNEEAVENLEPKESGIVDEVQPVESEHSQIDEKKTNVEIEQTEVKKIEKPPVCSVCNEQFETRNKLFEHIKKEGHAALKPVDETQPLSHNAAKRNKRLAKSKK